MFAGRLLCGIIVVCASPLIRFSIKWAKFLFLLPFSFSRAFIASIKVWCCLNAKSKCWKIVFSNIRLWAKNSLKYYSDFRTKFWVLSFDQYSLVNSLTLYMDSAVKFLKKDHHITSKLNVRKVKFVYLSEEKVLGSIANDVKEGTSWFYFMDLRSVNNGLRAGTAGKWKWNC